MVRVYGVDQPLDDDDVATKKRCDPETGSLHARSIALWKDVILLLTTRSTSGQQQTIEIIAVFFGSIMPSYTHQIVWLVYTKCPLEWPDGAEALAQHRARLGTPTFSEDR